jgi:photosynthetic reaction center cytochrome c subunit
MRFLVAVVGAFAVLMTGWIMAKAGWTLPPVESTQVGYRGTGAFVIHSASVEKAKMAANVAPPPSYDPDPKGPRAKEIYPNLQVLGDLSEDQLNRLMASMAEWVAPNEGCTYCHNPENMADYSKYQIQVARRMLVMTRAINTDWKQHVGQVGVTCYTCHRGNPVPQNIWFKDVGPVGPQVGNSGWVGWNNGQNAVARNADFTSLPYDALSEFLLADRPIRVHTLTALPSGNKAGIMDTEHTYALMVHMSQSLGVGCVFCHSTRAFNAWDESPPQRVTAFYGIRMTRALNKDYLVPLTKVFPADRLGVSGDAPKVGCSTCHAGVNKPLYGANMLKDYLAELGGKTQ